jgi:hypothetical protein
LGGAVWCCRELLGCMSHARLFCRQEFGGIDN